jgi:DNA-binding transcriptional MocR family regulator
MYVPGEIAYPKGSSLKKRTQMRLSFGVETPETIREGMQRLSQAVRHVMN